MDEDFKGLRQDFLDETQPMLERVETTLVEMERRWKLAGSDAGSFPSIKSDLHTIKGSSGMMGFASIQSTAHAMEDVVRLLVERDDLREVAVLDLLLQGAALIKRLLVEVAEVSETSTDTSPYVERVRAYVAVASERRKTADRRSSREWRSGTDRRASAGRRAQTKPPKSEISFGKVSDTVRIDFAKLDNLIEQVGEAVIVHSVMSEIHHRLAVQYGVSGQVAELERAVLSFDKILNQLQQTIMETRLLPVSAVFSRFNRLVRDLGAHEGKEVRLVTRGDETRIDKRLIDRLGEPLLHVVRNAIAHGIESPDERVALNKPREGTVTLAARQFSDRVVIVVRDDGRGLDTKKIREKALQLGYDVHEATDQELYRVIFQPDFSTSEGVSELAGRGVGLSVVATAVRDLGGNVETVSIAGRGTEFRLNLPLTLTVVKSLLVEIDNELYAVPLAHVVESVRTAPDAIHEITQRGVVTWRGELIHIADGGEIFASARGEHRERAFYIVVSVGGRKRGILVDRLVGHQDIVVKALDDILGRPETVSGATILGDGRVAFIMDAPRLLEQRIGGSGVRASASVPKQVQV